MESFSNILCNLHASTCKLFIFANGWLNVSKFQSHTAIWKEQLVAGSMFRFTMFWFSWVFLFVKNWPCNFNLKLCTQTCAHVIKNNLKVLTILKRGHTTRLKTGKWNDLKANKFATQNMRISFDFLLDNNCTQFKQHQQRMTAVRPHWKDTGHSHLLV